MQKKLNLSVKKITILRTLFVIGLFLTGFFFFNQLEKKEPVSPGPLKPHSPGLKPKGVSKPLEVKKADMNRLSSEDIEKKISSIDQIISDENYIERANKNLLSKEEKRKLSTLFFKRDKLYKEKIQRFLKRMDKQ